MTDNLRSENTLQYLVIGSSDDRRVAKINTAVGRVYQIRIRALPYLNGSVYLVAEDERSNSWTLVDAGGESEDSLEDIERGFQEMKASFEPRFSPDRVDRILLTHAHIDHFGGAAALKETCGAEVWVHAFESGVVEAYDDCARVENRRYARFLEECGVPNEDVRPILDGFGFRPGRARSVAVDRRLFGGERFGAFRAIYLPGHSPGHLAFRLGDAVFSGDLLLSKTLTQIWPARTTPQTGLVNYLLSLRKLRRIADATASNGRRLIALPAHEDVVVDIPKRVSAALRATERRNLRLLNIICEAESPISLAEAAPKMYWSGRPNREFFAFSDVASRAEFLLLTGLIKRAETLRDERTLRYLPSFSDAESAKDTIQQILRMDLTGDESDLIERDT